MPPRFNVGKAVTGGLMRAAGGSPVGMAINAALGAVGTSKGASPRGRRRGGGMTARRKRDLLWIKDNLGKTAAANYMRGKGW